MNNRTKAYSLILYFIWPFSAVLIGIRNIDTKFGRVLLIAAFIFLGYTAEDNGDLESYAARYYELSSSDLNHLIGTLLNFQSGKFFTDFTASLFSIFDNYHIYFAFLFGFFGYFLVNSISLIYINIHSGSETSIKIGFVAFALFYSILTIFNYAFYMGGIYFLYFLLKIIFSEGKLKYYIFILLTPVFHIGLVPVIIIPIFYSIFKQKTKWYLLLLVTTTFLSQTFLINNLETLLVGSNTVFESRFNSYASDSGRERLETRYAEGYESGNFNYKLSRSVRRWVDNFGIPLLLFFLYLNRQKIKEDRNSFNLFNVSIACFSITTLMLNISQGERFYFISGFMILAVYAFYIQIKSYSSLRYQFLLFVSIPLVLLSNTINLIMAKNFTSISFYFSNLPSQLFELF